MPRTTLRPLGYTGRPIAPVQEGGVMPLAGDSVNLDTHRGVNWPSKGYQIVRRVGDSHSKACFTWNHRHTDEGRTGLYFYDTALYPEDGSDDPTAIKTGLTTSFRPVFVSSGDPNGQGVFFNGVNSESQLIQEISSALDARNFSMAAPTGVLVTAETTGGSLADDDYYVMVTAIDTDGAVTVESYPQIFTARTVTGGGGNGNLEIDITSATFPARTTHYRVYVSSATSSVTDHRLEATTAIATTETNIGSLTGTGDTPTHINEFLRQAHLPLSTVTCACIHDGRLFIGSNLSNEVYFSERGNFNHWYSINAVNSGAESGFSGGVTGLCSARDSVYIFTEDAVHRAWGEFAFENQGDNPSYLPLWSQKPTDTSRGAVGPNAVTVIDGAPFFFSTQGIAVLGESGSTLLAPVDAQGMLDDLDQTYRDRWVLCQDPNGYLCALVTRLTNTTRPMDGASIAGIADRILRFDLRNRVWACPLAMGDITHIAYRTQEAAGTVGGESKLMAGSMTGRVLQLGIGWSGGDLDTSASAYDGQASTDEQTTTVTYIEAGVSADAYNGRTVTLKYPDTDTNYPGVSVQKTVVDTGVSGSNVTLTWVGSLTVPSGSGTWTVRVAGLLRPHDLPFDPGSKARLRSIRVLLNHVQGVESVG